MKKPNSATISSRGAHVAREWGRQIRSARKAREFSQAELAERARVSVQTLMRMEAGQAGTALGSWINVFEVLGLMSQLQTTIDPVTQAAGLSALGQRVRLRKPSDDLDF